VVGTNECIGVFGFRVPVQHLDVVALGIVSRMLADRGEPPLLAPETGRVGKRSRRENRGGSGILRLLSGQLRRRRIGWGIYLSPSHIG